MAKLPQVNSVILCDDVRTESNNKEIIIGVYSGAITFANPAPARMLQLIIRLELKTDDPGGEFGFVMQFEAPSGATIMNMPASLDWPIDVKRAVIHAAHQGLVLYESGEYKIKFGVVGDMKTVETVLVIFGQQAPAAQARLATSVVR